MAERGVTVPSATDVFDERAQLGGWSVTDYGHAIQIRPPSPPACSWISWIKTPKRSLGASMIH